MPLLLLSELVTGVWRAYPLGLLPAFFFSLFFFLRCCSLSSPSCLRLFFSRLPFLPFSFAPFFFFGGGLQRNDVARFLLRNFLYLSSPFFVSVHLCVFHQPSRK
jgi:hypothetical protein